MGFLDIFRREERSAKSNFLTFADVRWQQPTHAGVEVTQATAPQLPAVFRCWMLNADVISTLPVDVMVKRGNKRETYPEPHWFKSPNDYQDWGQFIHQVQLSYESDGNAFILKAVSDTGALAGLFVLPPTSVDPEMSGMGLVYNVGQSDGSTRPYAANEIIHIRGLTLPGTLRGLSPIECARQSLGIGFAAEQFGAQYFGNGATLTGVVTVPATAGTFDEGAAERIRKSMERKHGGISKSHAIGVLTGGATWTSLSVNPNDSQFLETRQYTDVQIAHMFGCPSEYVTSTEGAKGYVSGLYARQYMWLQTGINPRLVRLERAFSALLPGGAYIKFNRNAFLQMDPTERVSYYASAIRDRWMVPNEARSLEDMDPLEDGDKPLWSVQWQDGEQGNALPPGE